MKPWLLSRCTDYPPAQTTATVHDYISAPSPLIMCVNNEAESLLHTVISLFGRSGFLRGGCVFPGGRIPKTKPGNKDSISSLIRLPTCFGKTNHFITPFTIGHHSLSEVQYFKANFPYLGFIHQFLSINLLSYPYLLS